MSDGLVGFGLLAADPFNSMGKSFRGDEANLQVWEVLAALAFLAGLVLVAWMLSRALSRQDRVLRCNSPRALFRELCQAHGLSGGARRRLARLARRLRLTDPATLFLDPRLWDEPEGKASPRDRADLMALRGRLFGEQPEVTGPPSGERVEAASEVV